MVNKFQKELGLPPQSSFQFDAAPWLCFYSNEVSLALFPALFDRVPTKTFSLYSASSKGKRLA